MTTTFTAESTTYQMSYNTGPGSFETSTLFHDVNLTHHRNGDVSVRLDEKDALRLFQLAASGGLSTVESGKRLGDRAMVDMGEGEYSLWYRVADYFWTRRQERYAS